MEVRFLKRLQEGAKHAPLKVSIKIRDEIVEFMIGVPRNTDQLLPGETYYGIPNTPHIFIAKELHVLESEGEKTFYNQVVLLSHGGRVKGEYLFGDRQKLTDILEAYSILAEKFDLQKINFLCACNSEVTTSSNASLNEEMFFLLKNQNISFGYSNIYLLINPEYTEPLAKEDLVF